MKKTIIVQLSIQEAKTEQFLQLANSMITKSNSESGCITYKLLNEVNKENSFLIYEKYENEKAVETHNSSEYFKSFLNSVTPLVTEQPIIEIF